MEQYKYGPLVYNTTDSNDDTGNYYWPGEAPVGYDDEGIPVDSKGFQCLDAQQCPLHPSYSATEENTEHNEALGCSIPTLSSFNSWFEDAFIKAEPRDLAFFVIRWLNCQSDDHSATSVLYEKYAKLDIDDIIDTLWPSLKAD